MPQKKFRPYEIPENIDRKKWVAFFFLTNVVERKQQEGWTNYVDPSTRKQVIKGNKVLMLMARVDYEQRRQELNAVHDPRRMENSAKAQLMSGIRSAPGDSPIALGGKLEIEQRRRISKPPTGDNTGGKE